MKIDLTQPNKLAEHARKVSEAFAELANGCPYRGWDDDCEHPKIEMNSMNCAACNCPLLLE
jgi:hypothetical protein